MVGSIHVLGRDSWAAPGGAAPGGAGDGGHGPKELVQGITALDAD